MSAQSNRSVNEEAVRGWRLAHFSLVFGGMWLLVVAAVSHLLVLSRRGITIVVSLVGAVRALREADTR